jgi:gluconate kinase
MTREVVLVCGVQGSGKSWVCRQLKRQYAYVPHDRCWTHPSAQPEQGDDAAWGPPGSKSTHVSEVISAAKHSRLPVITEVPFDERSVRDQLTGAGLQVTCVFVVEEPDVLARRYFLREKKSLPAGVQTRAAGLTRRAREWGCFSGTSDAVLKHLKAAKTPGSPVSVAADDFYPGGITRNG